MLVGAENHGTCKLTCPQDIEDWSFSRIQIIDEVSSVAVVYISIWLITRTLTTTHKLNRMPCSVWAR